MADHQIPGREYGVGFRFDPRDDELMLYLMCKINNSPMSSNPMNDASVYDYTPEDLAEMYEAITTKHGEKRWYFFTHLKYKEGSSDSRPIRAAGDGYWRLSGSDKEIIQRDGRKIGVRKALAFHRGRPNRTNTGWIMYEYIAHTAREFPTQQDSKRINDWILCIIHKRRSNKKSTSMSMLVKEPEASKQVKDDNKGVTNNDSNNSAEMIMEDPFQWLNMRDVGTDMMLGDFLNQNEIQELRDEGLLVLGKPGDMAQGDLVPCLDYPLSVNPIINGFANQSCMVSGAQNEVSTLMVNGDEDNTMAPQPVYPLTQAWPTIQSYLNEVSAPLPAYSFNEHTYLWYSCTIISKINGGFKCYIPIIP